MTLGQILKNLRLSHGITQQQLADRTGIKQQNISRWELGIHIPDLQECVKLADYFDVSLDELADRDFKRY